MTQEIQPMQRAQGALLGLAVGDAVGTTLEFKRRGTFEPIDDMVGGGPFRLQPGQWTDDTSMALCLATSLIERNRFDLEDQMRRYLRWAEDGYLSSTGRCFDIGVATSAALRRFRRDTSEPRCGDPSPSNAGNGCLMRLAPVPIRYAPNPPQAVEYSELQARGTHQAPECIAASRVFCEILVRALNGFPKEAVLGAPAYTSSLPTKINAVVVGQSYRKKPRNAIRGTGYVVDALEAALWAFDSTATFKDCVLAAANLGDDADTTAAIAGQVAGAFYGLQGIPLHWLERLHMGNEIAAMAAGLFHAAREPQDVA